MKISNVNVNWVSLVSPAGLSCPTPSVHPILRVSNNYDRRLFSHGNRTDHHGSVCSPYSGPCVNSLNIVFVESIGFLVWNNFPLLRDLSSEIPQWWRKIGTYNVYNRACIYGLPKQSTFTIYDLWYKQRLYGRTIQLYNQIISPLWAEQKCLFKSFNVISESAHFNKRQCVLEYTGVQCSRRPIGNHKRLIYTVKYGRYIVPVRKMYIMNGFWINRRILEKLRKSKFLFLQPVLWVTWVTCKTIKVWCFYN